MPFPALAHPLVIQPSAIVHELLSHASHLKDQGIVPGHKPGSCSSLELKQCQIYFFHLLLCLKNKEILKVVRIQGKDYFLKYIRNLTSHIISKANIVPRKSASNFSIIEIQSWYWKLVDENQLHEDQTFLSSQRLTSLLGYFMRYRWGDLVFAMIHAVFITYFEVNLFGS